MSENIYDILNRLPKDVPVSMSEAEPIYESVDSQDDLSKAVQVLSEKFDKYKVDTKQENDPSGFKIAKAKREMQLAMAEYPEASGPEEAIIARMGDQTEALAQQEKETKAFIDNAKATIAQQQQKIDQTAQAVNDANARYDAQERRFQDFNKQVAASELDVKQQAQAAMAFAKQPQAQPADIIDKVQAQAPQQTAEPADAEEPTAPTAQVLQFPAGAQAAPAATKTKAKPKAKAKAKTSKTTGTTADTTTTDAGTTTTNTPAGSNVIQGTFGKPVAEPGAGTDAANDGEEEEPTGTYGESMNKNKKMIKEDRQEGDELLGIENWGLITQAYEKAANQVILTFGGNKLPLTAPQIYGIVQIFNGMDPNSRDVFVRKNLSFFNSTMQLLNSPQVVTAQENFPTFQANNRIWQRKQALAARKYNPKQQDFFGNPTMSENIKNIAESLMERFASFKEAAKPDFLDLDKDGDTEEPMKSAAKDAKEHEPAKIDKDAVAKRKRLQALKDRQEDERAEKGDYDHKSSSRFVKGHAYGGAAQKDDEEKDLDEAGYSAKAARAGKDIGKPGKAFAKIAKSAGERYGSKERGEKVAGAVLKKLRANEGEDHEGMRRATDTPEYHTPPVDKAAVEKHKQQQAIKDRQEDQRLAKQDPLAEKAVSKAQQKFMGMVYATKKGEKAPSPAVAKAAKGMTKKAAKDFAKTKHKGLPQHVAESRNHESSEYTYETVGRILSEEQPHLDCNSEAFVKAVYDELIELKMTPKAARWLCHYDEDFLSDTATSYKHFCDSKEKEMAECGAPMNSFVSEEPVVDAVQELDEIARLAGLAPKMEAKCSSCSCADCKCNEAMVTCSTCNESPCSCSETLIDETAINEAATRKEFRAVAELLRNIEDVAKRTELALHHADIFKQQNPRFKKEMFLAAAGVDTTPIKDEEVVDEAEVGEGNEFSGALAKARAEGKKEFEVDGKKYTVKEDINLNVSATGEEDVVNLIRKLSGMPVVAIQAGQAVAEEVVAEEGPKERDIEHTNTPREEVAGTDAAIPSGTDLNRAKKSYSDKPFRGDNPMAVAEAKEEQLWRAYESMINDLKA